MKVETNKQDTPAEVQAVEEAWFRSQVDIARLSLGSSWPDHKGWVIDYLHQEIRQRLMARGWRQRNG